MTRKSPSFTTAALQHCSTAAEKVLQIKEYPYILGIFSQAPPLITTAGSRLNLVPPPPHSRNVLCNVYIVLIHEFNNWRKMLKYSRLLKGLTAA